MMCDTESSVAAELERFNRDYRRNALQTIRLVSQFEDKDLALKPGPGSMSSAEQIAQICGSANFLRGLVAGEAPDRKLFERKFNVSTVQSALNSLIEVFHEVERAGKDITPEIWYEVVEPFGPEHRSSRGELAQLFIEHEIHHRGQLTVYLRISGKVPPVLYEPVDEKILDSFGEA